LFPAETQPGQLYQKKTTKWPFVSHLVGLIYRQLIFLNVGVFQGINLSTNIDGRYHHRNAQVATHPPLLLSHIATLSFTSQKLVPQT
jgi:hypothetical protein